ncbi:ribosomal RNA small subunit methyltransferase A [Candidatus Uhrbacteria bacterium]|nr:ribosomal RNA small subunit methyltransferase A [Candidatus Uhrbacteria bacterium]
MTPTEIRSVLASLGGAPNKRLGQNFLIDKTALETIVAEAEIEPDDLVLEVGPGLGVLTGAMIEKGAAVTSVERDRRFAEYLKKKFPKRFDLIEGDASRLEWENHFKNKNWKFISNLPYSITSLAIRKALYAKHPPSNLVVLVQKEVAERILARDQKHSLVSLMVAFASHETRLVKKVPPGAFFPSPKVDSAILRVIPMNQKERQLIWGMNPELIMSVAKRGFAHPRKLLASNLGIQASVLEEIGIPAKARAEDLSPASWQALTLALEQAKNT